MDGALGVPMVERTGDLLQLAGNDVLTVELGLVENPHEDVLGQDVLDDHLAHVRHLDLRVDGLFAQLQELIQGRAEGGVGLDLLVNDRPQCPGQGGNICAELLDGLVEEPHLRALVANKKAQQDVERSGIIE